MEGYIAFLIDDSAVFLPEGKDFCLCRYKA